MRLIIIFFRRPVTTDDIYSVTELNQYGVLVTTFYFKCKEIASMVRMRTPIESYELNEVNYDWESKTVANISEAKEVLAEKLNAQGFKLLYGNIT